MEAKGPPVKQASGTAVATSKLVSGIQVDTTGVPRPVTANCPAGTTVIGGGATVASPADELIGGSSPASTTGWTAEIFNEGNGILTASVTAICAPAAATAP